MIHSLVDAAIRARSLVRTQMAFDRLKARPPMPGLDDETAKSGVMPQASKMLGAADTFVRGACVRRVIANAADTIRQGTPTKAKRARVCRADKTGQAIPV